MYEWCIAWAGVVLKHEKNDRSQAWDSALLNKDVASFYQHNLITFLSGFGICVRNNKSGLK